MKVDMIQRPGRTDEAIAILAVAGVLLAITTFVMLIIFGSRPGPPETESLFDRGDRVTILVNGSSGIVKKAYYYRKSRHWAYDVRLAVGMEVMEFSEDELSEHAKGTPE